MNKYILNLTLVAVGLTMFPGCETPDGRTDHTGNGILAGATIGALSGALIGGRHAGEGALIGGAVGAVAGGAIGNSMDNEERARLRSQAPATYSHIEQGQPLSVVDVKAMAKSGINDDIIISQIRNTHTVYKLSANDIIDLRDSGVSDKVITYMTNTPTTATPATANTGTAQAEVATVAPPPPQQEVIIVEQRPGPDFVWIDGEWSWRGGGWVWSPGYWGRRPYGHTVWVRGGWEHRPQGWVRVEGRWR